MSQKISHFTKEKNIQTQASHLTQKQYEVRQPKSLAKEIANLPLCASVAMKSTGIQNSL